MDHPVRPCFGEGQANLMGPGRQFAASEKLNLATLESGPRAPLHLEWYSRRARATRLNNSPSILFRALPLSATGGGQERPAPLVQRPGAIRGRYVRTIGSLSGEEANRLPVRLLPLPARPARIFYTIIESQGLVGPPRAACFGDNDPITQTHTHKHTPPRSRAGVGHVCRRRQRHASLQMVTLFRPGQDEQPLARL